MDFQNLDWHAMGGDEVLRALGVGVDGLSEGEARARFERDGANELPRRAPRRWWGIVLDQLASPLMVVLLAAAGVSLALGERTDAGVIVAAVALNAALGFAQEYKANQAMERLRSLVQPVAIVRREGRERSVAAGEVVLGDLLVLSAGDRVCADARVIECGSGEANESALTGESGAVRKGCAPLPAGTLLADRTNMVFAGTSFVSGRAVAVVVSTGARTELGKIALLVGSTDERETPLQAELARLARWLSLGVVIMVVALFSVGLAAGRDAVDMFQVSVALAVAAIPEGLGISVTIVLAVGMQRMARRHALVRRLVAAETLGSVSVICTDKTGTITEGNMAVESVVGDRAAALEAVTLCNDAEDGRGSPTERALLYAARESGINRDGLARDWPRISEIAFDSQRKYMATAHRASDGSLRVIAKGAPERILAMCAGGGSFADEAARMAADGLRVIAVGERVVRDRGSGNGDQGPVMSDQGLGVTEQDLRGLRFLGFVGLRDPLRPEAAGQIRAAAEAGVRTVIVTGDHPETARAIARQAGISGDEPGSTIGGEELDRLDDAELDARLADIRVFARVEPRHKIRVVGAWQRKGASVAVTGDGVNDAPALKAADIGVALGSGTEVAKEASDMVLLDDNLSSITAAIEQGRVIFDNMRRSVVYLLASGLTEMTLIAGALLFGLPLPLLPGQILWINLVADSLPNAALAFEPGEPDIMRRPPRPRREPVFNRRMAALLFTIGIVADLVLFALYVWAIGTREIREAQTLLFAAVGVSSLAYVFAVRSFHQSVFKLNPFTNPWLLASVFVSFGLLALAVHNPWLSGVLGAVPLSLSDWGLLAMIGFVKLGLIEGIKRFVV